MPKQKGTGKAKRSSKDDGQSAKRRNQSASDTGSTSTMTGMAGASLTSPLPQVAVATPPSANASVPSQMQRFNIQTGVPSYSVSTNPASALPSVVTVQQPPGDAKKNPVHESKTWFEACQRNGRMDNEAMLAKDISAYVRYELFPKLKFIMNSKQLNYSSETTSICGLICTAMGLVEEKAAVSWWERYKDMIADVLNAKRADVTGALKRAFLRK